MSKNRNRATANGNRVVVNSGPTYKINGRRVSEEKFNAAIVGNLEAAEREIQLLRETITELREENNRLRACITGLVSLK